MSLSAWQSVLPKSSAAFGGLQNFADAQMPLRILLREVLEQHVVFEDMATHLSAMAAGAPVRWHCSGWSRLGSEVPAAVVLHKPSGSKLVWV